MDRASATGKEKHPPGVLLALNAGTGKVDWRREKDIYGTLLVLSPENDVLLMSYQRTRFRIPSEVGGRMAAFRASSGKPLWDRKANYMLRPTIVGKKVYFQSAAYDLMTGAQKHFELGKSYGCGVAAASRNLMLYRSATMGYFDLRTMSGTQNYGGIRLGCWINAIPAGGLVLVPDAATGCRCSYLNHASIALEGDN